MPLFSIATVEIEELLKSWGEFKGEPPVAFATESVGRFGFSVSETVRMDSARCQAYVALRARMASVGAPAVQYALRPTEVIVLEAYATGKLELVAFTDLSRFSAKKIDSAPVISIGSDELYLQEPSRPKTQKDADWKDEMLFVPFWWVVTTTDEESANMELVKRTVDGVAMPIYVNKRKVNQFERLAVYKPKVVVKPLASAKTVTTVEKAKRARVG
jgi:hypothetical protein